MSIEFHNICFIQLTVIWDRRLFGTKTFRHYCQSIRTHQTSAEVSWIRTVLGPKCPVPVSFTCCHTWMCDLLELPLCIIWFLIKLNFMLICGRCNAEIAVLQIVLGFVSLCRMCVMLMLHSTVRYQMMVSFDSKLLMTVYNWWNAVDRITRTITACQLVCLSYVVLCQVLDSDVMSLSCISLRLI